MLTILLIIQLSVHYTGKISEGLEWPCSQQTNFISHWQGIQLLSALSYHESYQQNRDRFNKCQNLKLKEKLTVSGDMAISDL